MLYGKGSVNPPGFTLRSGKHFAPSIAGFRMDPLSRFRPETVAFPLGSMITRVTADHAEWSVMIGLGRKPTDSKPYIRMASVRRKDEQSKDHYVGLFLEGNPLSSTAKTGGFTITGTVPDREIGFHEECWKIMQGVIELMHVSGALKEGSHVNDPVAIGDHFLRGDFDRVVESCLNGNFYEVLKSLDPNSIERVDDLNYEIALGIEYDPEPPQATILAEETVPEYGQNGNLRDKLEDMFDLAHLVEHVTNNIFGGHNGLLEKVMDRLRTEADYGPDRLSDRVLDSPVFHSGVLLHPLKDEAYNHRVYIRRGGHSSQFRAGTLEPGGRFRSGGAIVALPKDPGDDTCVYVDGGDGPPPYMYVHSARTDAVG